MNKKNLQKHHTTSAMPSLLELPSAKQSGYQSCLECGQLAPLTQKQCDVCQSHLVLRKPQSLTKTMAYLLASILLFFPANLLPIMRTTSIGMEQNDTKVYKISYKTVPLYRVDWTLVHD